MSAGRSLYVYYRVDPSRLDAASLTLAAAQSALLADWPALQAERMQRDDSPAGGTGDPAPLTWMEVYRHPDGLSEACLADLRQRLSGLPEGRLSDRHEELFVPLGLRPQGA